AERLVLWDRNTLLALTPLPLVELYRAANRRVSAKQTDRGEALLKALRAVPPGKEHWTEYQVLVGKLAEYLFVPPLGLTAFEIANASKADRRDIVMANGAQEGAWMLFRQLYRADFVVIDAKNHADVLKKRAVLEVAHYLKWYGVGLFALVACRH